MAHDGRESNGQPSSGFRSRQSPIRKASLHHGVKGCALVILSPRLSPPSTRLGFSSSRWGCRCNPHICWVMLLQVHPHVIRFIEVFLTKDYLAIAMEYAAGGDLHRLVSSRLASLQPLSLLLLDLCTKDGEIAFLPTYYSFDFQRAWPGLHTPAFCPCQVCRSWVVRSHPDLAPHQQG